MKALAALALIVTTAACGAKGLTGPSGGGGGDVNSPGTVASSGTENEGLMYSETQRFSGELGVHVTGALTEYEYKVGIYLASGWYVGSYTSGSTKGKGTAYYYRPYVLKFGKVVDGAYWETATNVAGHETCHAETGPNHDHKHWLCMSRIAQPTYPDPGEAEGATAVSGGIGPGYVCAGGMAEVNQ